MFFLRKIYEKLNILIFLLNGKKPWSRGYCEFKKEYIKGTIRGGKFNVSKLPSGYGFRIDERIIEYPWLFSRLPDDEGRLLDAGSVLNFDFLISEKVVSGKKIFISTLAPETYCFWRRGISYVYEDLRDNCFKNDYFDWIVSLSTIEHIGLDNTLLYTKDSSKKENNPSSYLEAISEFRRVLKPGGRLYVSVPFGRRKNSGWFQVFDSEMLDQLIEAFSPSCLREDHFKYEPDGWHVSTRDGSKDATYFDIHEKKKYDPDYAAFSMAVVCLEMIK